MVLAQVHEADKVTALLIVGVLVGDPNFDARDLDTGRHMRQTCGEPVVIVVEILRQEKVPVGVVIIALHLELGALHAALCADCFGLGVLLRHQSGQGQIAELELALDTEQRRTSADQTRSGGHADVADFEILDYLVLLSFIRQFQVLGIEIERSVGVVSHVELQFVAHRRVDGGLYLDGAVTDSIPYEKFLEMGYDRLVVILTKDIN